MRTITIRQFSQGLALSIAITGSAMAEANSVKVIYAAENALYGAGYDIGRADGWMDEALRAAVREYQARSDKLSVTGNLDSATLSSLGISSNTGRTVADNVVASKAQALAALGMTESRAQSQPKPISKPEPKPRLQPKPAFTIKELPAEPKPEPVEKKAPAAAPDPVATPQPVTVAKAEPTPAPQVETPDAEVPPSSQQPAAVTVSSTAPASQPEPQLSAESQAEPEPSPSEDPTASELAAQLPDEPTAAGRPDTEASNVSLTETGSESPQPATTPAPEPNEKSRNIFGTLFDFLFGWLV